MKTFYLSSDHYNLMRCGRKRAVVVYLNELLDCETLLGVVTLVNESREHQTEAVLVVRTSFVFVGELSQADAELAGYLYLHQLRADLEKQRPELESTDAVAILEFTRQVGAITG